MERALITSERQRLLAERQIHDLTAELQTAQSTASSETRSRPPSALRSPALRHKSPELKADSKPPDLWEGRGDNVHGETKSLVEALAARERERDLARAQLHTALTLLERQSQLKAAISSIANTAEAGVDGQGDRAEETAEQTKSRSDGGFETKEDGNAEPAAEKNTEGGTHGGVGAATASRDDGLSRTPEGERNAHARGPQASLLCRGCQIFRLHSVSRFALSCLVRCAD
jgi:hypothetical protein